MNRRRRTREATAAAPQEGSNPLARWRQRRKALRESRLLINEARRILRKYRASIKEPVDEEVRTAIAALEEARAERNLRRIRERAEKLDELLEKHLAFGRKSAFREYAESIGVAVLIALLLRAFVVEAFKIPSGSMIPTLRVGDHIFVNKFIYGLRIPWTDIKYFATSPRRGSVVVFIYPQDEDKDFIKRVIAVGGDTVAVRDNVVYVNGRAIPRRKLDGECQYIDGDEDAQDWNIKPCVAFEERHGEERYRVIQDVEGQPLDFKPFKVPEGQVFVMGDNRDHSHDSRVWGTVPLSHVKGRAMIIWWSSGPVGGDAPGTVRGGIRWPRFFSRVHRFPEGEPVLP